MARIRTIKPEFWEDEAVGSLSREARLLFIATWNLADDAGRLRWTAEYVKAHVFPYDPDLKPRRVAAVMEELVKAGMVVPYTAGAVPQQLAVIRSFAKHQKINRPQSPRLPEPPDSLSDSGSGSVNGTGSQSVTDSRPDLEQGREQGSSSSSVSEAVTVTPMSEEEDYEATKAQAVAILAERHLAAWEAKAGNRVVNVAGWLAKDRQRTAERHASTRRMPGLSAEALADFLEPPPARPGPVVPPPFEPVDLERAEPEEFHRGIGDARAALSGYRQEATA